MAHTRDWDTEEVKPTATDLVGDVDDRIREGKVDIRERMEQDHYWGNNQTTGEDDSDGHHKKVTMSNTETVSAGIADAGIIHVKDVSSKGELHYMDEDDNDVQITDGGELANAKSADVADGIVETGASGDTVKTKIVDMPAWNMDTTSSVYAAHGLTLANIRRIDAIVRTDAGTARVPINGYSDKAGGTYANSTNVYASRITGALFDQAGYSSTSFSRGFWVIDYVV